MGYLLASLPSAQSFDQPSRWRVQSEAPPNGAEFRAFAEVEAGSLTLIPGRTRPG
jgi:hypothetical protein